MSHPRPDIGVAIHAVSCGGIPVKTANPEVRKCWTCPATFTVQRLEAHQAWLRWVAA